MGIIAFLLESPHGTRPRTVGEHLRTGPTFMRVNLAPAGDARSDAEIGREYARLGARRILTEAANGGSKFDRLERVAAWRARFVIQVGDSYRHVLDMGVSTRDGLLASIRDRAARAAEAAEVERARLDRAFFGLDTVEIIIKRPRLALMR